ncbi:DUF1788 domain-containing protein [Methanothermobacter sp. THM-1]|uniref:DUF1788 domain-containing protein n=1 Tax=Methanothermobacter sp. THM-1 TaxID=2606911 RepID=UPI001366B3E0|nr:DUF1788 domain-containing protein [Methanothermobacter sp. THM-1]QHN06698.1 DUF1788 domain-containing protein [Methanothermobacter sp. THM-1]
MSEIHERLDMIELKIKDPAFRENRGLGNEVGYYIFDYDPRYELEVRSYISYLRKKINENPNHPFKIAEFDLYEIIISILKEKGYLSKTFEFEEKKGSEYAKKAVNKLLKLGTASNLIVSHIKENTEENSVVFLTGVGKAYPILRSHNVLNNLYEVMDNVPVILFFPGRYSGSELILFGTIHDNNYYRAFPLVE